MKTWKNNWDESRDRYLEWWEGKGLLISMWEHLPKKGAPHEEVLTPETAKDLHQQWLDPGWRAKNIHYQLSRSSFLADILPVANTHLGPGSLAAIMGAELEPAEDTIWIKQPGGKKHGDGQHRGAEPGLDLELVEDNKYWKLHVDLLRECRKLSGDRYFVGCPDLVEGLDVLASLKGTDQVLMDMLLQPEKLEEELASVNRIYFEVFDRIYEIIQEEGEMAFCYFSLWGPGKVSKLQSDISVMISEDNFRRFAIPFLKEQCQKIDYTLYHLDGVDAIRHLDAILEIEELNAVQWTPGVGEPQGGDPSWYELYRKILASGKSIMPCWVQVDELKSLLDKVGNKGLNILMDFKSEKDIDAAQKIAEAFR